MNIIGIDIGGTKCAVVSATTSGEIKSRNEFDTRTDLGLDYTLGRLYEAIEGLLEVEPKGDDELIFGISCGGPLDSQRGLVMSPPNLPGWDDVPITQLLTERFGGKAYLLNDANACALAEWHYGAGKGSNNVIFLTFGTGLGAGLILDGRLYTGANGLAGEVGHIRLAEDGPEGYGKAGSFEGFCSGGGIAKLGRQMVADAFAKGETVGFCPTEKEKQSLDAKAIAIAARDGDPLAKKIIAKSAFYLGRGLSILIDILNPDVIVIGSIYARNENLFKGDVLDVIRQEALAMAAEKCKIVPAALDESIGDYGAIAAAAYGLGLW